MYGPLFYLEKYLVKVCSKDAVMIKKIVLCIFKYVPSCSVVVKFAVKKDAVMI